MKSKINFCAAILLVSLSAVTGAKTQIAAGGNYVIEKSVIANGGANGNAASAGGNYSIEGTIGQNAAGTNQQNTTYKFQPGFWTAAPTFVPTAAVANVGGRVLTADGSGIRNVPVKIIKPNGESRTVLSSAFGYFRFDDVAAGETYIFSVSAKRYNLQPADVNSFDCRRY